MSVRVSELSIINWSMNTLKTLVPVSTAHTSL